MSNDTGMLEMFLGLFVRPAALRPEDIMITDIAHALSLLCRFGGHCSTFYSVAEHSVHVSRVVPPADALWGLLHDASEAYIVDLPAPLKRLPELGRAYREIEGRIQWAVCRRFGLSPEEPASVRTADTAVLMAEVAVLMPSAGTTCLYESHTMADINIGCYRHDAAERLFLERFKELTTRTL